MTLDETGFLICDILSFDINSERFLVKLKNYTNADWNDLLTFSSRYKLTPLLYSKLFKYKNELPIPPVTMELFRNAYMNSVARYAVLHHEIKSLLRILNNNKIGAILLKGAYIAEKFYEKPGLRPMCDIDILVKKEDIDNIFDVLLKNGYTTETKYDRSIHLPIYTKSNTLIEVHWDISPHFFFPWKKAIPMNKLFCDVLKEKLFGMEISMIPTEYLIVYLCDKIVEDNFRGMLLLLYDIALIINRSVVNWNKLTAVAIEWSSVKDVFCTLYLTKTLYSASVPDCLLNSLKPQDFNNDLIKFMYGELFGTSDLDSSSVHFLKMMSHKNLFFQIKRIFKPENLEVIPGGKGSIISKVKFIFFRLRHLIRQYGNVLCFKQIQKGKDVSKFYKWLKKN